MLKVVFDNVYTYIKSKTFKFCKLICKMLFGLHLEDVCAQTQHGHESTFTPQSFLFPNETEDLRNTANKIAKKGIYNKITLSCFSS